MVYIILAFVAILIIIVGVIFLIMKRDQDSEWYDDEADQSAFYDCHSHILPGVDDGAANMETALRMLEKEVEEGVTNVILTPHFPHNRLKKQALVHRFEEFQQEVESRQIPVKLYLGNEILYHESFLNSLAEDKICTMNQTSYILIEFYPDTPFSQIRNGLNEAVMAGYRPIIAHMERYAALQDEERITEVIQMGALIQVNTSSFFKNHVKKFLLNLAKKDKIHLLGSDCHSLNHRPPMMRETAKLLQKELTPEQFERLFYTNPEKILNNQYI